MSIIGGSTVFYVGMNDPIAALPYVDTIKKIIGVHPKSILSFCSKICTKFTPRYLQCKDYSETSNKDKPLAYKEQEKSILITSTKIWRRIKTLFIWFQHNFYLHLNPANVT